MGLAAVPDGPVDIPPVVGRLAASAGITPEGIVPAWRNELGGLTFRLGDDRYVKWIASRQTEIDFVAEAERLAWAHPFVKVPEVLGVDRDDDGQWLLTRALPGESAVSPRWLADPERAAAAIGRGLRTLHDSLPVAECPYTWSVEERVARFEERVAAGATPDEWMPEHRGLTVAGVREALRHPPPLDGRSDGPVVCHGDACAPNTLLDESGGLAGQVDLGRLGVADRWADLAVAAWSTEWNYGPGFEAAVYRGYGVDADEERIRYYRLLWDVS
jgi:kanamycin kinase